MEKSKEEFMQDFIIEKVAIGKATDSEGYRGSLVYEASDMWERINTKSKDRDK